MKKPRRLHNQVLTQSGGSGPGYLFDPSALPQPPLRDQLSAFRRARRSHDVLPAGLLWQINQSPLFGDAPSLDLPLAYRLPLPGRARRLERVKTRLAGLQDLGARVQAERGSPLPAESRLLVGPVGVEEYRLFAVPTSSGKVSFFAIAAGADGGSGSTAWVLDQGLTWHMSWNRESDGSIHLIAYGLLSDDVTRVQVKIDNTNHDAVLGENGFIFETKEHNPDDVTGFDVFYCDRTSATTVRLNPN